MSLFVSREECTLTLRVQVVMIAPLLLPQAAAVAASVHALAVRTGVHRSQLGTLRGMVVIRPCDVQLCRKRKALHDVEL